jgi:hypothetical protein
VWLNLVERLFWVQEVGGSNPLAPTNRNGEPMAASGNLGLVIFIDAVLIVLACVWAIVGGILTREGVLDVGLWTILPILFIAAANALAVLFALVVSKL